MKTNEIRIAWARQDEPNGQHYGRECKTGEYVTLSTRLAARINAAPAGSHLTGRDGNGKQIRVYVSPDRIN